MLEECGGAADFYESFQESKRKLLARAMGYPQQARAHRNVWPAGLSEAGVEVVVEPLAEARVVLCGPRRLERGARPLRRC